METIPTFQKQRGLTVRYPASLAISGNDILYSKTHVIGVQGYREDKVHLCLLLNPPPGGHLKEEKPNPDKHQVVELLFSNFSENRPPKSKLDFDTKYQDPNNIDGFAILVATSSVQQPKESPSVKSSPSAKNISFASEVNEGAAYLNSKGYGLNITEDGDVALVGKNSSVIISDKTSLDASVDTNKLRSNLQTTENFISKQMMIPDNIETFPAAHDPTINIVEIINAATSAARYVLLAKQAMDLYEEFTEWKNR